MTALAIDIAASNFAFIFGFVGPCASGEEHMDLHSGNVQAAGIEHLVPCWFHFPCIHCPWAESLQYMPRCVSAVNPSLGTHEGRSCLRLQCRLPSSTHSRCAGPVSMRLGSQSLQAAMDCSWPTVLFHPKMDMQLVFTSNECLTPAI